MNLAAQPPSSLILFVLTTMVLPVVPMSVHAAEAAWSIPGDEPRTWVLAHELDAFRAYALEGEGRGFFGVMRREFDTDYLHRPFPEEPVYFGDPDPAKRTSEKVDLWRDGHRRGADLAGIAQAATLMWLATGEDTYLERARDATLHMIDWDVSGTSGILYNDEVHYRLWRVFPLVYDQLRDHFSAAEKERILASFRERGRQNQDVVLASGIDRLERNSVRREPDSHPVRFMSMTGLAGLALYDDLPEARAWWELAQRFYRDRFPPWGGDDGGWAEGPAYWRAVTDHALFQDGLAAMDHPDAWQNPFWRNTGYYGVYFVPPERQTMFGDLSGRGSFGMEPGVHHFMRCQARIFQDGYYASYAALFPDDLEPIEAEGLHIVKNPPTGMDFFLRSFRASRSPAPPPRPLTELPSARHFADIGWVSMHSALGQPDDDIVLSFKSSPYGSFSHSHADQNAFILSAFGAELAINSGYREYHRSPHHQGWTRQTRSKNAVLINGHGQPVQDKTATGAITRFETGDRYAWATGDATAAYRANPELSNFVERVVRDVVMIDKRYVVTRDHVRLKAPAALSWLLHAGDEMQWSAEDQRAVIQADGASLHVRLLPNGNRFSASQTGEFAVPVDPKYLSEGYVDQFHLTAVTETDEADHVVYAVLWPSRASEDEGDALAATVAEDRRLHIRRPDGRVDQVALTDDELVIASAGGDSPPATILMDGERLAEARRRIRAGDPSLLPALTNLLHEADLALTAGPFAVTDKTLMPPSGDRHDYLSFGRYWWPDPDAPGGLPYIQRDGETNPDSQGAGSDRPRLGDMTDAVETLALAYYFTGNETYADRAALLITVWFLDPETRMNPHLSFAQSIPGRVEGRGTGILDARLFSKVIDGVALIAASPALSQSDRDALREWFGTYLDWLRTSPNAKEESGAQNNHGMWFDAQIANVALFAGETAFARSVLESAMTGRIPAQIEPDGTQPHELTRTRTLHYFLFNLEAMVALARMGEHVGLDLWNAPSAERSRLRAAMDYVAPYADSARRWPHPTINEADRMRLLPLLLQAAAAYGDDRYRELAETLPTDAARIQRVQLLYPGPE